jgi:hypothetical protein
VIIGIENEFKVFSRMSAAKHAFKHSEAARLIRAAKAAGCKVKGITFTDGVVRLEIDDSPGTGDGEKPNPWDEDRAPDAKRAS